MFKKFLVTVLIVFFTSATVFATDNNITGYVPDKTTGLTRAYTDTVEEILDAEIVRKTSSISHTFTKSELLRTELVENTIYYALSAITGGAPPYMLEQARVLNLSKTVDVRKIGGIYTDGYYVRRILYPEQKHLTVPVLYEFSYVTIYYTSPSKQAYQIAYIAETGAGTKLDKN